MSATGELRLVVIFEAELRRAGRAFAVYLEASKSEGSTPEELGLLAAKVFEQCRSALFHLIEAPDSNLVILGSGDFPGVKEKP